MAISFTDVTHDNTFETTLKKNVHLLNASEETYNRSRIFHRSPKSMQLKNLLSTTFKQPNLNVVFFVVNLAS